MKKHLKQLELERDSWMQTASEFCRSMEYYQQQIDNVAPLLGKHMFVCYDGSTSSEPLRAALYIATSSLKESLDIAVDALQKIDNDDAKTALYKISQLQNNFKII